mmetsp:Transcript_6522/g.13197  ORF Transcript_6522/g.13197 Transcript_6522/m.13197 type:complete len:263 (+) Transcript_6522:1572-2360(+)
METVVKLPLCWQTWAVTPSTVTLCEPTIISRATARASFGPLSITLSTFTHVLAREARFLKIALSQIPSTSRAANLTRTGRLHARGAPWRQRPAGRTTAQCRACSPARLWKSTLRETLSGCTTTISWFYQVISFAESPMLRLASFCMSRSLPQKSFVHWQPVRRFFVQCSALIISGLISTSTHVTFSLPVTACLVLNTSPRRAVSWCFIITAGKSQSRARTSDPTPLLSTGSWNLTKCKLWPVALRFHNRQLAQSEAVWSAGK